MNISEDLQKIIKNTIEATTKGVFDFINNENQIVDKFFKSEIPNTILEVNGSKNVSEYISEKLSKLGITYEKSSE